MVNLSLLPDKPKTSILDGLPDKATWNILGLPSASQAPEQVVEAERDFATQSLKNSTGNLLGLKPTEVKTGGAGFKQALNERQEGVVEPTIRGAIKETGQTLLDAVKNVPSSAKKLVTDIGTAVISPIETAKSLGGLALGLVQKIIPGEQESEKYVDALVQNYADRFGSVEKAKETFVNDPVGFLADTAGLLLAGGGAIKGVGAVTKLKTLSKLGGAVAKTGAAIDPLIGVAKIGKPIAKGLVKSAEKGIEKVLAPTKEVTKAKTAKVIKELTQEKLVAISKEELQKQIKRKLIEVGKEFDDFFETTGIKGNTKIQPLIDLLEDAKDNFRVKGVVVEPKSIKIIEGLQDTIKQFGDELPNTDLRRLRQIWDKTIAKGKRFDVAKTSEVLDELDLKKMLTDSMRDELAKANPKLAVINKKFAFYKNVDDVLEATIGRQKGQAGGLGKKLAFVGGLATGQGVIGKLVNATALSSFVKTIESTAWRTVTSALKVKLAGALSNGNKALILDIMRQIQKSSQSETK